MNTDIIQVILVGFATFGVVYVTIPLLIKVAYHRELYDKPDGDRKLHTRFIPTLGGIAIFMAFFVGYSITGLAENFSGYPYFAAAMVLLFFTGMKDDLMGLSPVKKLLVEVIAGCLLIFGSDIYIHSFYGVLGIETLPFWGSVLITLFTMIVVMNAYNLIDGIDGLAGGVGAIASVFFGIGFYIAGVPEMAAMSFILATSLVGFLVYNFKPAKIFMGDTGSLIVGFLLSVLAVQFIGLNDSPSYVAWFSWSSPVVPVAILIVPLYDTIRVFYRRAKRKTSPFSPGQDHIHHEFLRMGFGHSGTAIVLYFCTALITLLAASISNLNVHLMLATVLFTSVLIFPTNGTKRRLLSGIGLDFAVGPNSLDGDYSSDINKEKEGQRSGESKSKTVSEVLH